MDQEYDPQEEVRRAKRDLERAFREEPWSLCAALREKLEAEGFGEVRVDVSVDVELRPRLRLLQGGKG